MADEPAPTPGAPKDDPPAKTFTQAELDRIVGERIAREAKKYEGMDELRAKAERLDKLEADQQSELEKANNRAEKAEQTAAERIKAANSRLIEAAVLTAATQHNAIKPEHLHRLIDTETVTVGDDGQVTGAGDAVKAFLDANPEYVGSTRPSGSADQGARDGGSAKQITREQLANMSPQDVVKAQADGRLTRVLQGG